MPHDKDAQSCSLSKVFQRSELAAWYTRSYTQFGGYFVSEPQLELLKKPNEDENKGSRQKWKLPEKGH